MAFLDNSGDIILDAVLTDLGRKRLASGRFSIYKFALGDEEINYQLWNSSDNRGSSFYDLQIMQTPILEAFTSDQSLMKSRLLSFSRTDLLYLPVLKVNNRAVNVASQTHNSSVASFYLIADEKTRILNSSAAAAPANAEPGFIFGVPGRSTDEKMVTTHIAVDQGIDSAENGRNIITPMDPELLESAFLVKVDNRLISMNTVDPQGAPTSRVPQYIDDDYCASYYFVKQQVNGAIRNAPVDGSSFRLRNGLNANDNNPQQAIELAAPHEMFQGSLGRTLQIVPSVKSELQLGTSIFTELGSIKTGLTLRGDALANYHCIDTTITVQGLTTGYSVDIPIKIIKGIF
jgi:hypothetical protein